MPAQEQHAYSGDAETKQWDVYREKLRKLGAWVAAWIKFQAHSLLNRES
jgi:hypothetical protein